MSLSRKVLLGCIAAIVVAAGAIAGDRALLFRASFIAKGTGAAERSAMEKLRDTVSVKDFKGSDGIGCQGDNAHDDTECIQAALNYAYKLSTDTGAQGTVVLNNGQYKITAPLIVGKGTDLVGQGANFAAHIRPAATFVGAAAIIIDGDLAVGGFNFRQTHRDYTIDGTATSKAILPITIKVNKAYNIKFENVYVFNGYGTGIDINAVQDVTLVNVRVWGVVANAGNSEYGIRVHDSSGAGKGATTLIEPDVESYFKGISQEDDTQVTVITPYMERNIVGWQAIGTANGSMTVLGGLIQSPSASGNAATITGPNVTVFGGTYIANGGTGLVVSTTSRSTNVRLYGPGGTVSDARNYSSLDLADSTNWYPAKTRNYKAGVTSGAATTFYTITIPFSAAYYAVADLTLNARDASGFSVWTGKYRFAVTNADGTVRASPVTEYAKSAQNASGNYSIAEVVAATVSGSTILVQITSTTAGALGAGVNPNVSTELEMIQWDVTGPVYVVAN